MKMVLLHLLRRNFRLYQTFEKDKRNAPIRRNVVDSELFQNMNTISLHCVLRYCNQFI